MKAEGNNTCIIRSSDGIAREFSYHSESYMFGYYDRSDWVEEHIGVLGKDFYYLMGRWWFVTEEDLLMFLLRFKNG